MWSTRGSAALRLGWRGTSQTGTEEEHVSRHFGKLDCTRFCVRVCPFSTGSCHSEGPGLRELVPCSFLFSHWPVVPVDPEWCSSIPSMWRKTRLLFSLGGFFSSLGNRILLIFFFCKLILWADFSVTECSLLCLLVPLEVRVYFKGWICRERRREICGLKSFSHFWTHAAHRSRCFPTVGEASPMTSQASGAIWVILRQERRGYLV